MENLFFKSEIQNKIIEDFLNSNMSRWRAEMDQYQKNITFLVSDSKVNKKYF